MNDILICLVTWDWNSFQCWTLWEPYQYKSLTLIQQSFDSQLTHLPLQGFSYKIHLAITWPFKHGKITTLYMKYQEDYVAPTKLLVTQDFSSFVRSPNNLINSLNRNFLTPWCLLQSIHGSLKFYASLGFSGLSK